MPASELATGAPARDTAMEAGALARDWAVVSLVATLLTGGWMRAALAWPGLGISGGLDLGHVVHAHSHVAFFGWLVLGAAALTAPHVPFSGSRLLAWRGVVHAIGVLSLVAGVGFARWGYALPTIVLSAMHVALWFALAWLLRPARYADPVIGRWWRTTWRLLLLSGAVTIVPAVLAVRGIHGGWWREVGIKLFLALFVNGFAMMTATGVLLAARAAPAWLDHVRRLMVVALIPLAVLYVDSPAPRPWLTMVAHGAILLLGACTLATAWVVRGGARSMTRRIAFSGLVLVGSLQVLAATGTVDGLMQTRPITIAFTHLELLVVVTPLLGTALAPAFARSRLPLLATSAVAVMCAALVVVGWPALARLAGEAGVPLMRWFPIVGAAGVVAATAWLLLVPSLLAGARPRGTAPGGLP